MASYRRRFLKLLSGAEKDYQRLFGQAAQEVRRVILRNANPDGSLDTAQLGIIKKQVLPIITAVYLSPNSEGDRVAYDVVRGTVIPRSPYMRVLWKYVEAATRLSVEQHGNMMRQKLAGEDDLLRRFERATVNPLAYAKAVQDVQQMGKGLLSPVVEAQKKPPYPLFQPDPLWQYDPLHQFVYAGGQPYRLSDRIWNTAASSRRKLDTVLDRGVTIGKSALELADDVEQFLQPGRVGIRTYKPYGEQYMPPGGASFDAMRLARTEITASRHRAAYVSANLNPFVVEYERRLSNGRTAPCDVCKEIAAGGPYAKSNLGYLPPSHPHCMCYIVWITAPKAVVVEQLRAEIAEERDVLTKLVTPIMVERLTRMLLAEILPEDMVQPLLL